ncbi:MAG: hypothetical protein ACRERE_20500 [Candidatus Entotheonellia bacterium]
MSARGGFGLSPAEAERRVKVIERYLRLLSDSLATRVARELGLPVDAPRALAAGTMERCLRWHSGQR